MEVLMACSEVAPIVKVGGLADAVAALSKTLSRLETKVTIALPRYRALESAGLMMARRLTPLRFSAGDEKHEAMVFDARLGSGVELILIEIGGLYDRDDVYGYDDDAARFGLFCRAVAELVRSRAGFDAVHAHDWQTALIPHLLKGDELRTVLTVHNAAHHGRFAKSAIDDIGLSWDDFTPDALEYYGDINMLKAGVLAADAVTTVSRTYAAELAAPGGAGGLDGVFKSREDLIGILNGIDYSVWSPATDPHITARYDAEDAANKGRCKASLLHELDLSIEPQRPLLVSLGRVDEQKGSGHARRGAVEDRAHARTGRDRRRGRPPADGAVGGRRRQHRRRRYLPWRGQRADEPSPDRRRRRGADAVALRALWAGSAIRPALRRAADRERCGRPSRHRRRLRRQM